MGFQIRIANHPLLKQVDEEWVIEFWYSLFTKPEPKLHRLDCIWNSKLTIGKRGLKRYDQMT